MGNEKLDRAKKAKNDEFYTQMEDIDAELSHYGEFFKGKRIFCNCDNPFTSNFPLWFMTHFNRLGLKRLMATGFCTGQNSTRPAFSLSISNTRRFIKDGKEDLNDREAMWLIRTKKGLVKTIECDSEYPAGDFRGEHSLRCLKQADVVVTNPPFSLAREFVGLLEKHRKKYVLIMNYQCVTYKDFFPLIMDGKMRFGFTGRCFFKTSCLGGQACEWAESEESRGADIFSSWFTNIPIEKKIDLLKLDRTYRRNEGDYPSYDNYDAIEVGKASLIPYDYDGCMGVPFTAMPRLSPAQFEIMGIDMQFCRLPAVEAIRKPDTKRDKAILNGKYKFKRLFIRNRQPGRCDWDAWQKELDGA